MSYHLCLSSEVRTFSLVSKGNLKNLYDEDISQSETVKLKLCIKYSEKGYFPWIPSLNLK